MTPDPDAKLDDGLLDIGYASRLFKLGAFNLSCKTLKGTHIHHKTATLKQTDRIKFFVDRFHTTLGLTLADKRPHTASGFIWPSSPDTGTEWRPCN